MNLPFTPEQFLNVFRIYNESIWPVQVFAYLLGGVAVYLAIRPAPFGARAIPGILTLFWLWNGAAYHLAHFTSINKMAYLFGTLFLLQGGLFFYAGIIRRALSFRFAGDTCSLMGLLMILYAMILYPVLGHLAGHSYPAAPVFGVAPCPTAIFTFGLMLWTAGRIPQSLLVIPLIWSLIGFTAALKLGIYEDVGLLAAGVLCGSLVVIRDRRTVETPAPQFPSP